VFFVRVALVKRLPCVPRHSRLVFQAVHTDDVAESYRFALLADVRGALNIAADPVFDPEELGQLLGARPIPVSTTLLRSALTSHGDRDWSRRHPDGSISPSRRR